MLNSCVSIKSDAMCIHQNEISVKNRKIILAVYHTIFSTPPDQHTPYRRVMVFLPDLDIYQWKNDFL